MPWGNEPVAAAAVAPPLLPHLRKRDLVGNGAGFATCGQLAGGGQRW